MKICLSARIVEGRKPRPALAEFLDLAAQAGYDGVSLRPWQIPSSLTAGQIAALKDQLQQRRLEVCSLVPPGPVAANWAYYVALAGQLKVKVIQVSEGPAELLRLAGALSPDMRIGPQVHTGGAMENVASSARALAAAADPRVGVIVEPANLMLAGITWQEGFLEPLRGRIIGCHLQSLELVAADEPGVAGLTLRDGAKKYFRRVPLGANRQINLPAFLRELRRVGYADFISVIEPVHPGVAIEELASATARALREQGLSRGREI